MSNEQRPTPSEHSKQSGGREPIKLPIPPGKAIVFDHIAGKVYVANIVGPWTQS